MTDYRIVLLLTLALAACRPEPSVSDAVAAGATAASTAAAAGDVASALPGPDEHSYARPDQVVVRHLLLDLAVDFEQRVLAGTATLQLDWRDPAAAQLLLDTRDLEVSAAEAQDAAGVWQPLAFSLGERHAILGSPLTVQTPGQPASVRLTYRTVPSASGLQWLSPAMTQGKQLPFMFSQSQQIHARSWVPLQDTTLVRFTYEAHLQTPASVMALMSADNDPAAERDGDYRFSMPQPIPSYLLAIAAGDLVFQPVSTRAGVWAEPALVAAAAAEFADTEQMISTAESLYGPYRWERYDMLVLPPSFPYGGMENPRLTFLTPTVIVGDRSLVALIAHELAHSWSGNLVTFALSRDAWLNEGITSYVENRLIEDLYGKAWADMENVIERNGIADEFTPENLPLQRLAIEAGVLKDPDENLSATVYAKGAWFMQFLEQRVGRSDFDDFLRGYFDHFAFQSISSQQFADYAQENLLSRFPDKVSQAEFEAWLYAPGIPAFAPVTVSERLAAVDAARAAWLADGALPPSATTTDWTTQEWVHFLEGLPATLTEPQLAALDAAYGFTGTANAELAQRWYPLTVRSGYLAARPAIAEFLSRVGRRKLIMPTYSALAATPEGLLFAREVFASARAALHPITIGSVTAVLAPGPVP